MFPALIADYQAPRTIDAALDLLSGDEDIMFIAGGMSLMQAMKARLVRPSRLIDLQHVSAIKGIAVGADGITIGAMTRYRDIAESTALGLAFAALTDATSHVGDRQVRNRGTIGGSLCWNYITACTPVASVATGASIVLQSKAAVGAAFPSTNSFSPRWRRRANRTRSPLRSHCPSRRRGWEALIANGGWSATPPRWSA